MRKKKKAYLRFPSSVKPFKTTLHKKKGLQRVLKWSELKHGKTWKMSCLDMII